MTDPMTTPPLDMPALRAQVRRAKSASCACHPAVAIHPDELTALLDRVEELGRDLAAVTVSRDGWQTRAEAAEAKVAAVRELHTPVPVIEAWGTQGRYPREAMACLCCTSPDDPSPTLHPCPTIAALDTHTPETETTP